MARKTTKKQRNRIRIRRVRSMRREQLWWRLTEIARETIRSFIKRSKKQARAIKKYKHENNRHNWKRGVRRSNP